MLLAPNLSQAAGETLTIVNNINFGEVVPKAGSCIMNPANGNVSPATTCVSGSVLGEYTITATPNTIVRIRAVSTVGHPQGFVLEPTMRLTNNLGGDSYNLLPDTDIDFSTGSDGNITVYLGGTFTFPGGLAFGSSHNFNVTLVFNEL